MTAYRYVLSQIMERAYKYDPKNPFKLASGESSDWYVDLRQITMDGNIMPHISKIIENILIEESCIHDVRAIGGVTMGADPIAASYAYRSGLPMFSVRKKVKDHGTEKLIEGPDLPPNSRVVIVEDTVTTGGSTVLAIRECNAQMLNVLGVICFVNRQEHYFEGMWRKQGLPDTAFIRSIYTAQILEEERKKYESRL